MDSGRAANARSPDSQFGPKADDRSYFGGEAALTGSFTAG